MHKSLEIVLYKKSKSQDEKIAPNSKQAYIDLSPLQNCNEPFHVFSKKLDHNQLIAMISKVKNWHVKLVL
jgi:hypothetical protein